MKRWVWLCWLIAGCDVVLMRGLSAEHARELSSELDRRGISARTVREPSGRSLQLEVARQAVPAAVALVAGSRHARREPEPVEPRAWIETRGQERAREARALAAALARSLERLPGVLEARVHVQLSSGAALLPESLTPPAASVLLIEAPGRSHARAVRELVAGAMPGLSPEAVQVVESVRPQQHDEPARLTRVGPIAVESASAPSLRALAIGSLTLHMLLAALLLAPLARRLRRV